MLWAEGKRQIINKQNWDLKEDKQMEHLIAKLLQDFEQGKMTRRQLIQSLALAATAASASAATVAPTATTASNVVKATYLNHLAFEVADYARSRDWYADLFGMKVVLDDGKKANLEVGESLFVFHTRQAANTPVVDHIGLMIADWDKDKNVRNEVVAELKRRGLEVVKANERSLYIKDPDGFAVQMGGKDQ
jgi:catechol 2,3-dioxygenase-like lactoylglutathione lyase family enzyme